MKRAFTMVELVLVIVIIGVLSAIAVPRFFTSRDDAILVRARADISSIRSAIVNIKNTNMLSGTFTYPDLEKSATSTKLFDNVLSGGIKKKGDKDTSGWSKSGLEYVFTLSGKTTKFSYDKKTGYFGCAENEPNNSLCKQLTE
ncbi:type II secretion system protein [Campylobacter sp. RM16192]|uniref:type II secretion system protein n=1 Tax=Campylobacter sp. RM16192 TaxID=1660080 RepID=UPI001452737B|nr:type II secretion system protein [Campylobacter sp. RM16192]QCD52324.1 putative type II secretion system protein [Campylobacter sp. RM16192]